MKQITRCRRWNSFWMLAAIVAGIACFSAQVQAQDTRDKSHTFHASVLFGKSAVHAHQDIETAMRAAGFDAQEYSLFGNSVSNYPFTSKGGQLTFTAHYRLRSRYSAGVIISSIGESTTAGLHGLVQFLDVEHAVRSVAVTGSAKYKVLRIEFGPSWNQTRIREVQPAFPNSSSWHKDNKLGFIAGATLSVPVFSVIGIDAGVQYRYIGSSVAGPYTPTAHGDPQATFPETKVNFNHWFFGIGPAIRF